MNLPFNRKVALWSIFGFTLFLLIIAGSLFAYQKVYAGKIYRNVFYSGVNLSGMTRAEARDTLAAHFEKVLNSKITVTVNDQSVKAKPIDMGLTFDFDRAVESAYRVGRDGDFANNLLSSTKTVFNPNDLKVEATIDQQRFSEFNEVVLGALNSEPKNASIAIQSGEIVILEGTDGKVVDTNGLAEKILALADENSYRITLDTIFKKPDIQSADFTAARAQAEGILNTRYTFTYNDKTFVPTRNEIGNWITFEADSAGAYKASYNDSNIKAYLNSIAKNFEVKRKDKRINALTGEVIEEGANGILLNKDVTLTSLKETSGSPVSIPLVTYEDPIKEIRVTPAEGFVPGRFEGRYLDVDLTQQKMCRIESTSIVDCFIISSGKPGMDTPTGTFYIQGKHPRAWSARYGLYMPWWQQFSGPYGIHELPEWPNGYKEGENHLGIPVSHGCVRLGIGAAETVYNWTSVGTPIYIHK
jgi:vancomycin resistance protein YoaR